MNKKNNLGELLTILCILLLFSASGQDIYFKYTNGTQVNYSIADISKITFNGNETKLHFLNNTSSSLDNTDLSNFLYATNVGFWDIMQLPLNIYPNPSNGKITIQFENMNNNTFRIYDQQGRNLMSGKLQEGGTDISLHKLPIGTYFIHVEGDFMPRKIVIND